MTKGTQDSHSRSGSMFGENFKVVTPYILLILTLVVYALKSSYVTTEKLDAFQDEVSEEIQELRKEFLENAKQMREEFVSVRVDELEKRNLKENMARIEAQNTKLLKKIEDLSEHGTH